MPRNLPSGTASGSGSLSTSPRPPPHRGLRHIGSSTHLFVPGPGQGLMPQAAAAAAYQQPPPMHVAPHSHSLEDLSHAHSSHEVAAMALHSPPHPPAQRCRRVLVTGGSGFLGRHLIQTLLGLGHEIHCFDLVQSFNDARVRFFLGDLSTDTETLTEACTDVDTVFHTASLTDPLASLDAIRSVNVTGTRNVIRSCLACGVRNLIYTSTTAVIFNGASIEGLREDQCTYPRSYLDPYSQCKAEAEREVIAANGLVCPSTGEALCTVSLRPHAIFGPRDTHFISQLILRARSGEITHMIGSGHNLVDFTYIGNVVHAMIITMDKLSAPVSAFSFSPAGSRELSAEFLEARAKIGGQAFFITNDDPRPFWGFISLILNEVGCIGPTKHISYPVAYVMAWIMEWVRWIRRKIKWIVAKIMWFKGAANKHAGQAQAAAASNEASASAAAGSTPAALMSPADALTIPNASSAAASSSSSPSAPAADQDQVGLTRHMVCVMSKTQYYSISKARELLGYEPIITLDQGLDMTINYFFRRRAAPAPTPTPANGSAQMGRHAGSSSALSHQQHQQQIQQQQLQQQPQYADATSMQQQQWQASQLAANPARLLTRVHSLPTAHSALQGAPGGQPFPPASGTGLFYPSTPQHEQSYAAAVMASMHPSSASYSAAGAQIVAPGSASGGSYLAHASQSLQQQQPSQSAHQLLQMPSQWPHRHHSTSPPFPSPVDSQQQQLQMQMQYASRSGAPQAQPPQQPQQHYLPAPTVNGGSVSPFAPAAASASFLHPPPPHSESYLAPSSGGMMGRGMPNVPSSAFLNAYDAGAWIQQQQMPAAVNAQQQQARQAQQQPR